MSYVTLDERTARRLAPAQAMIEQERLVAAARTRASVCRKRHAYLRRVEQDINELFRGLMLLVRTKRRVEAVVALPLEDGSAMVSRLTFRQGAHANCVVLLNVSAHAIARLMQRLRLPSVLEALRAELHTQRAVAEAILALALKDRPIHHFQLATATGQFRGNAAPDGVPTAATWLPNRLLPAYEVLVAGELRIGTLEAAPKPRMFTRLRLQAAS